MNTFRVLRKTEMDGIGVVWIERGTIESNYAYYIDADTIGQQYGEGEFMLIDGDRVIGKNIVAESYYSDAPEPDDDGPSEDEEAAIADAFTPPDPFSRKA